MLPIAVLIATTPRLDLLTTQALPSVAAQTREPDIVVVASDKASITEQQQALLRNVLPYSRLVCVRNARAEGAAGTWNTGLAALQRIFRDCYIAILDDDDRWHSNHLSLCEAASKDGAADAVLSGILVEQGIGSVIATHVPRNVQVEQFLTGNPGWQGSNTFVKLSSALSIGGFTDGLTSCNDRDFAIRALQAGFRISYTSQPTVTWTMHQRADALSAPGSAQKLQGAARFLKLYRDRMTPSQVVEFFSRMERLFDLERADIENAASGR